MARPEKENLVKEIQEKFEKAKMVAFVDYRGLNVEEVTALRKQMREAGVEYKVIKNTMTQRAAEAAKIEGLTEHLVGPLALAFDYDDYVNGAKILAKFAETHDKLKLTVGVLDGKVIDNATVKELAHLPSREALLTQVVGMFQAPLRSFVYAVEALRKKQAEE